MVITGASSGFGELAALRFGRAGARVVLAARRLERLEALAERIASEGGSALAIRCDVTELEELTALRDRVATTFERCDVLVNNAGIRGGGPFETTDIQYLNRVIDVNMRAVVLGTKLFLPMMVERGRGHVVNIASLAGRFATPGAAIYGATKHAVVAFSEALYYEGERRGVLVTAVNPGLVATEGFPQDHVPPRLVMKPERVAAAIVRAVQEGIAPELAVPRWLSPLEAFRVLTPPLYRWGVRRMREVGVRATQAR